jgi:hypothetical protein
MHFITLAVLEILWHLLSVAGSNAAPFGSLKPNCFDLFLGSYLPPN